MVSKEEWKRIYNFLFSIFPPSDDIKLTIKYKTPKYVISFHTIESFLIYVCLNSIKSIKDQDVEYIINDESLYNKMNEYVDRILNKKESH